MTHVLITVKKYTFYDGLLFTTSTPTLFWLGLTSPPCTYVESLKQQPLSPYIYNFRCKRYLPTWVRE